MNALQFITEAQKIVSGKHIGYSFGSDRIYNYEFFVRQFAMENPEQALQMVKQIADCAEHLSNESNMTPTRVSITASILEKTANQYVDK